MPDAKRQITIFTVAQAAGVSPATVSRAINHPDLLNAQTRRRVEDAIRETGYIRNRAAQAMHGRRSGTIGLIVPTVDYAIFATLVQSFGDTADALSFTLLLATHGYDLGREHAVLRKLLEHRVDGVALIGLDHAAETFALLERQQTPAIALWNYDPSSRLPCVGARNALAGRLAAQHLVELGHRRIGLVFPGTADNDRARARLSAAREVLAEAGCAPDPRDVLNARYDVADAKAAVRGLLRREPRPTALLCGNDVIARGAIHAVREAGLAVPADVSIIGIGDFPGSADMTPGLSTVRIPAEEIGAAAAEQLVDMIGTGATRLPGREFSVALMIRGTTCPA